MKWIVVVVADLILGAICKYLMFIKIDSLSITLGGLVVVVVLTFILFGQDKDNGRATISFIIGFLCALIGGAIMSTFLV